MATAMPILVFWTLSKQKIRHLSFHFHSPNFISSHIADPPLQPLSEMRIISKVTLTSLVFTGSLFGALNYQESNDLASVEAEDCASQALDSVRRW